MTQPLTVGRINFAPNNSWRFGKRLATAGARNAMAIPRQLDALLETMYRLEENGIELLGFTGGTSLAPTITAAAHPMLYTLFKDTIRKGYRQDGVRRREAWEARNPVNGVIVRWEEVVCGG